MAKNFKCVVTGHQIEDRKSFIWKDGSFPQSLEPMPEIYIARNLENSFEG